MTNGEVLAQLNIIEKTVLSLKKQIMGITETGWQSSRDFMHENHFSRTRLNTLVKQGKVVCNKITPRYYEYRWKTEKSA